MSIFVSFVWLCFGSFLCEGSSLQKSCLRKCRSFFALVLANLAIILDYAVSPVKSLGFISLPRILVHFPRRLPGFACLLFYLNALSRKVVIEGLCPDLSVFCPDGRVCGYKVGFDGLWVGGMSGLSFGAVWFMPCRVLMFSTLGNVGCALRCTRVCVWCWLTGVCWA